MGRSASSQRRAGAVIVLMTLVAVLGVGVSAAAQESPLEPLDTTSPRATFTSFLDQVVEIEQAPEDAALLRRHDQIAVHRRRRARR